MRYPAFLFLLLSACGAEGASAGDPRTVSADTARPAPPVSVLERGLGALETFWLHQAMTVRAEPDESAALVRVLPRGERVVLGPKDPAGWAPVVDAAGARIGYLYRASDDVRSYAPVDPGEDVAPRHALSSAGRYHRGPRGGCYTFTATGNKHYVDRSLCD